MLKRWKGILIIFGLLGLLALLGACAKAETVSTPTPMGAMVLPTATPLGAEVKPIPGGTLRSSFSTDPPHWDPKRTVGGAHTYFNFVHAFLINFHYGPDYPQWNFDITSDGLAERWEMSPDGKTYTFHLRKGVKFQNKPPVNGRELVAQDVKWTIEDSMVTPGAAFRESFEDNIERIECPDKYTVVFYLKQPWASFLIFMGNPAVEILPHEVKDQNGDFKRWDTAIGAGPFALEEYVVNVRMVFKKNPTYYRANEGLPYLDKLHYVAISDSSTSLAAFRSEKIDIRGISRVDLASVKGTNPDVYCYETELGPTMLGLTFRSDKPPFNDVRVRQAVSMALDRQAIIDRFYYGYGVDQQGLVNAGSPWYLKDKGECDKYGKYNTGEAKRLLAEAGYPQGFSTDLNLTSAYGATHIEYAEMWVDALAKIGIKTTLRLKEFAAFEATIEKGDYEGLGWMYYFSGFNIDPDTWLIRKYHPRSGVNASKVNDPKINEMLAAQSEALTPEKRQEVLNEFQRYDACQVYYVPWPLAYGVTCLQPWVRNYKVHAASMSGGRIYEMVWVDQTSPGRK